ncbi:hypothetical protein [Hyphomicrobium sp. ghe19]|uniref:hypothetical protein n=1 Tax=Hyphomicrobium sp. ghe19 TaxID=2682968 RepID=UPI0013675651|nr:hypothetical protein HYPP_01975 [Hyphomicrobium sp. ghe19]
MDAADLNDPAKAEAFVRESIADLAEQIARWEAYAHEKIQEYRERIPHHPETLAKLTRSVMDELREQIEPLRQHREALIETIVRVEATRLKTIIVPPSAIDTQILK